MASPFSFRRTRPLLLEALEGRLPLATLYVSTLGNDANDGSSATPWRTLQKAANTVNPGDTVIVRPGSYVGFHLTRDGTAADRITFQAEDGVSITQRNATTADGINLEGADYITIENFTVNGMPRAGIRSVTNQHVIIRNNRMDQNTMWGILTGFSDDLLIEGNVASRSQVEHGIYVSNSGDRPIIRNNTSWGNRANGIHMNGDVSLGGDGIISGALVENNIIYENGVGGGSGINGDGVQNSRFQNNLIYNNHASGISLYRIDGGGGASGNVVANNTIVQASDSRWAINISDGSTSNTVVNNILYTSHSFRGSITISEDSLSGFVSDYNVVMSRFTTDDGSSVMTLAQWQATTGQDTHSIIATPSQLFVNVAASDYHLAATSPAVDAGTENQAPTADLDNVARPSGVNYDIGAYERLLSPPSYTDWGTIDFAAHDDLNVTGAETWYRFTAARTGKATVDLAFSHAAGNVNLQAFDFNLALLGSSSSSTNVERVDFDVTGAHVYYIRITGANSSVDARVTNLVNVSGTTVNVFGTAGSDAFSFTHGTSHQVTVKGVTYTYTPAQLGTLNISGGGASDTLTVALGSLNDTVTLRPGEVTVTNSDYSVSGTSLEAISVAAGAGADLASLYDAASDDTLTASPASARFAGMDFDNTTSGFDEVRAYAMAGGFDVANLTDGATNDFFDAGPASAVLRGPAFFIRGEAFDQYKALATAGGSDRANLYDGGGNDFFDAGPSSGLLRGASFYSYAERFESLNAYATTGGIDQARLYDSAGNDFFDAGPHSAVLRGSSFYSYVERFDKVFAYAQWGGTDVAKLYDGGGNDFFDAGPTSGLMQGNGWYNWADRFEEVIAFANAGGNDVANLYGSIGNDLFTTTSNVGRLAGTNYSLRAEQFEQSNVRLHQGGADLAEFRDFLTADLLFGNANLARGTVSGKQTSVFDMDEVDAYAASGQTPTSNISAIDYLYQEIGTWL